MWTRMWHFFARNNGWIRRMPHPGSDGEHCLAKLAPSMPYYATQAGFEVIKV